MFHQVDVRVNRIAAPDDNEVGGFDLDRVRASLRADTGLPARHPGCHADCALHAGITEQPAQALHPEPLNNAEGAAGVVWPDRFRADRLGGVVERGGDCIECFVPADALELAFAFGADSAHRMR